MLSCSIVPCWLPNSILLCANSVFSVSLWLLYLSHSYNHRDTENTEVAQRKISCTGNQHIVRFPAPLPRRADLLRRRGAWLSPPRSRRTNVPPGWILKQGNHRC